ncbi:MAG: HlyD family type I secretion periplasmic adaptor subunit [Geminicoccaceae bacterium]|nr:MAG: HlyD family type I secretion periplasmic adaptor subunit [Geminicoccaceae bacterium]
MTAKNGRHPDDRRMTDGDDGLGVPLRPGRHVAWGMFVLGISLGGFVAWSAAAPLSSAVVAPGTVVVDSDRKLVQHPEGGVIEQIRVRDGDVVAFGQTLIVLRNEELLAADIRSRQFLLMAQAKEARLEAERSGAERIAFPPSVLTSSLPDAARVVGDQESIFRARRSALETRVTSLESKVAQANHTAEGLERQLFQQQQRVRLTQTEFDETQLLADKGFAPRRRLLELERALAQLEGRIAELDVALKDAHRSADFHQLEINQILAVYQEAVEGELQLVQKEIVALHENRRGVVQRLADLELRAPAAGTIVNMAVNTIGGVVGPRSVVMEVVPLDDPLVVDVRIDPRDVDSVAVGMAADIYLPGMARRSVPPVRGEVVTVSADLVVAQDRGNWPHYLARVRLPPEDAAAPFRPGLPVDVVVIRGERTLMSFMLEPLSRGLTHAFKD